MTPALKKLLIRRSLPYGACLTNSRPTKVWKDPTKFTETRAGWYRHLGKCSESPLSGTARPTIPFDNCEYQFFVEDTSPYPNYHTGYTHAIGSCRVCDVKIWTGKTDRARHLRDNHCSRKLIKFMKMIFPVCKCVVCGKPSKMPYWGFNFCSNDCVGKWRTNFRFPLELRNRIQHMDDSL